MAKRNVLAFDLGASSGRAIVGGFDGERITLTERHRFENQSVTIGTRLLWDAPGLFAHMCSGLAAAALEGSVDSIGIDTWGVDYALLDRNDELLGNPVCYRDERTEGIMDKAYTVMPKAELADKTGLAFMQFNTLYQLYAMQMQKDPQLEIAKSLLLMPDFLAWLFSGEKGAEFTHASTTQLCDPRTRNWSADILKAFNLPHSLFQPITEPGSIRGKLRSDLQSAYSVGAIPLIAVGSHDTASAVAAVPAQGNFAYISSGTWSLVGIESPTPIINPAREKYNLTNEGGVFGTVRVLKNVMGLWIIQECRRQWKREGLEFSFAELCVMAEKADPFLAVIDPDDGPFLYPGDMPKKVQDYCRNSGQKVPEGPGEIARVVFESLALVYRRCIEQLREATGQSIDALHIVGGGSNNRLLNQFTADALGIPVHAGPGEATALGNIAMQLYALGDISDLSQIRQVVRNSFPPDEQLPGNTTPWQEHYDYAIEKGFIR